jgi:hypothetical protein
MLQNHVLEKGCLRLVAKLSQAWTINFIQVAHHICRCDFLIVALLVVVNYKVVNPSASAQKKARILQISFQGLADNPPFHRKLAKRLLHTNPQLAEEVVVATVLWSMSLST